ncbi:DUF1776-domain-containing protein [Aaosphaeria arxii CBS 175.79]|uniref:DUF1776-domain-containing protein n=1 Tax=Aaosphaeria arxii CBS 175.79 TaxID=1450172 RepID=A0A6A5XIS6_9PLEO|nr:DUF1776-domain-containing protein [Aaosphaeria arxii CBS 175.79]KAF2013185.1 DUF1776-domain-containing protein [Aaosphaeria arxii CBS 175.79]
MTSDDQHFLDVLAAYTSDIRKFTGDVFDSTDRHFAWVASHVKKSLPQGWLPESARPPPPPPPPHQLTGVYLARLQDWISRHQALTAAFVAFFATGGLLLWREKKNHNRKRRARRASNGARKEVIVIAGPPNSPIVKSMSLDLERRGFIVYIVCADMEEEQQVHNESRADVRPLHLDVVDVLGTKDAMDRFNDLLLRPHVAFSGASPHNLHFRGLILVPDLIYPSGPVETVSPELWSDALNAKVLHTVAIAQAFLPTICSFKARVLMLTPSIVSALRPPFHSVETAVVSALEGFTASLGSELGTLGIDVCQFKLGTFDCSNVGAKQQLQPRGSPNIYAWPSAARQSYASNYVNQSRVAQSRGLFGQSGSTGSSLRELNNAVFDALTQKKPRRTWRVGRGSVAYDMVGKWVPSGLVGWMLGVRRVSLEQVSEPKLEDSVQSWEHVGEAV